MDKTKNFWTEEESEIFLKYGSCFIPEQELQVKIITNLLPYKNIQNFIYINLCCGEGYLIKAIAKKN